MNRLDDIKGKIETELAQQLKHRGNPDSREAKKTARIAGVMFFVIGIVVAGVSYYLYKYRGIVSPWIIGLMLIFLGIGLYTTAFGKFPRS